MRQLTNGCAGVQGLEVEADVERRVEVDEAAEPVGVDVARVIDEGKNPQRAAFSSQVRAAHLEAGRGDEVDDAGLPPPTAPIGQPRGDAVMDDLTERLELAARKAVDRLRAAVATEPLDADEEPDEAGRGDVAMAGGDVAVDEGGEATVGPDEAVADGGEGPGDRPDRG